MYMLTLRWLDFVAHSTGHLLDDDGEIDISRLTFADNDNDDGEVDMDAEYVKSSQSHYRPFTLIYSSLQETTDEELCPHLLPLVSFRDG